MNGTHADSQLHNLANGFDCLVLLSSEKKVEGVYTNARKQLLISSVPAVLVLHLKRFHQVNS